MSVTILIGDCRDRMAELEPVSLDACVCDPPYHLASIVKRFGRPGAAAAKFGAKANATGAYKRASRGFMGQTWDGGDVAFDPATWEAVYRILKPGAHLIAFSGTRTYHRMACAIEDAGFEIRDQLAWCYGSGFPKSHNQSGEWEGWGTALKPAWEPICLARKPLIGTVVGNLAAHGTGALNINGCRVPTDEQLREGSGVIPMRHDPAVPRGRDGEASATKRYQTEGSTNFAASPGPRGGDPLGRWPANIIHDGSDEVLAAFPETQSGSMKAGTIRTVENRVYGEGCSAAGKAATERDIIGDSGSAARFFYCAKATTDERGDGNNHPTVKPIDLMRWCCRLITPPGGTIIDPFMGSGSTLIAADAEQFNAIGCELSSDYAAIAERRIRDAAGLFAEVAVA